MTDTEILNEIEKMDNKPKVYFLDIVNSAIEQGKSQAVLKIQKFIKEERAKQEVG